MSQPFFKAPETSAYFAPISKCSTIIYINGLFPQRHVCILILCAIPLFGFLRLISLAAMLINCGHSIGKARLPKESKLCA